MIHPGAHVLNGLALVLGSCRSAVAAWITLDVLRDRRAVVEDADLELLLELRARVSLDVIVVLRHGLSYAEYLC